MRRNTRWQRPEKWHWPVVIWSLIATFVLCAIASFLLRHLSTGQTLALFAFAFLEMLIIRTIATMDYVAEGFETFSPGEE
jgi:hypothetical protein